MNVESDIISVTYAKEINHKNDYSRLTAMLNVEKTDNLVLPNILQKC
jgi:hypothetical protein